jgi:hypothetical protein
MRTLFGVGTPRGLQGRVAAFAALLGTIWTLILDAITPDGLHDRDPERSWRPETAFIATRSFMLKNKTCTTGC